MSETKGSVPPVDQPKAKPKPPAVRGPHGGARAGSGRKPLAIDDERRMDQRLRVRFGGEERRLVTAAAKALGWSTSRLIRVTVLERIAGGRLAILDRQERAAFRETQDDLKRQGANLNQIAFAMNKVAAGIARIDDLPSPGEFRHIAEETKKATATLRELLSVIEFRLTPGRARAGAGDTESEAGG